VVPRPEQLREVGAGALLAPDSALQTDEAFGGVARFLQRALRAGTGWEWPVAEVGAVRLCRVDDPGLGAEGYRLSSGTDGVTIEAAQAAGAFYGAQTLRLLLPPETLRAAPVRSFDQLDVPGVEILDRPRFRWRGQHVDVVRHFLPLPWLKRLVDLLALHKLNTLHLHLTDDQGWRMEIDRYPRLTEVGAWRRESPVGYYTDGKTDGRPHGGFYTKDDLRELVAYAAERFVNVVPEIELPGHAQAQIAAYPELGNDPDARLEPWTSWGVNPHIVNPEESTVQFYRDVLDEVLEVFPSRYVHIGGDEAPKTEWRSSERAQELMRERGLADEEELQSWFVSRIGEHLTARGRIMVGWDEILEGGLAPGAVVMSWRGEEGGVAAASAGHDVVIGPEEFVYLDWYQAPSHTGGEPLAIHPDRHTDVAKTYSYDPVPDALTEEQRGHVLGSQGHLWTEYVAAPEHAEYMLFPRVCAIAEVVWSPAERDFAEFEPRLREHLGRLDALQVNYRPLDGPTPGQRASWPAS
jgi:hexosaminidase